MLFHFVLTKTDLPNSLVLFPFSQIVAASIADLGLSAHVNTRCGGLSGGTARKLSTAVALLGNPSLILMDEPTRWGRGAHLIALAFFFSYLQFFIFPPVPGKNAKNALFKRIRQKTKTKKSSLFPPPRVFYLLRMYFYSKNNIQMKKLYCNFWLLIGIIAFRVVFHPIYM